VTEVVQSLARGLAVIEALDDEPRRQTLSDVARATGLTRAAARRFLLTLVELGYVSSDGRHFSLRPRVLEFGQAYLESVRLPAVAKPHMERMSAQVGESCSLAILDGTEVVYVERVATRRIMTAVIHVGTRLPAWVTSMGRVLLAHLPPDDLERALTGLTPERFTAHTLTDVDELRAELERVRRDGVSLVDQELELGLISMAVPVTGRRESGEIGVVAALNVPTHAGPGAAGTMRRELLPALQATAVAISADLRGADAVVQRPVGADDASAASASARRS
jgi:IclR family pca regulon transcriptional regulator